MELVTDRRTREPATDDAHRLAYRCFELGLILLSFGNVMEITPPLTITRADADEALAIFERGPRGRRGGAIRRRQAGRALGAGHSPASSPARIRARLRAARISDLMESACTIMARRMAMPSASSLANDV